MSRTGYALGNLSPIIYFTNGAGDIVLPPTTQDARWVYDVRFSKIGYEWREAGTLKEVDDLQKRLVELEQRKAQNDAQQDERNYGERWNAIGDSLRQRMVSSSTTPYEREFIRLYMQLREEKRVKHQQRWLEAQFFLWSREMDEKSNPIDRMK